MLAGRPAGQPIKQTGKRDQQSSRGVTEITAWPSRGAYGVCRQGPVPNVTLPAGLGVYPSGDSGARAFPMLSRKASDRLAAGWPGRSLTTRLPGRDRAAISFLLRANWLVP